MIPIGGYFLKISFQNKERNTMEIKQLQNLGIKFLGILLFVLGVTQLGGVAIYVLATTISKTYRKEVFGTNWHNIFVFLLFVVLLLAVGILTLKTADKCFKSKSQRLKEICKGFILILVFLLVMSHSQTSTSDVIESRSSPLAFVGILVGMISGIIFYFILTVYQQDEA